MGDLRVWWTQGSSTFSVRTVGRAVGLGLGPG